MTDEYDLWRRYEDAKAFKNNLAEIDRLKDRIEKLEAALRFIAGPSTVEFVDGTHEISETKMLSTYRRRAKRALEGNYDD